MMMAEVLKRHLFYEFWVQNNILDQQNFDIINYFIDLSRNAFSIQRISKIAKE
jgi:hypothetical protein